MRLKIFLSVIALFFVPLLARADAIKDYKVFINVNEDGSINVRETIAYDFGQAEKHGFFRSIPYKYERNGANYNLQISDISIQNKTSNSSKFSTSKSSGILIVKIGDADRTVTGVQVYELQYRVQRAINYFSDHDELYWNAIGTDWNLPIRLASATVSYPDGANEPDVTKACYSGYLEDKEPCQISSGPSEVSFTRANLSANQGMSVVVDWPKGLVAKPARSEIILSFLKDNWVIFALPIGAFLLMFWIWWRFGKDPKPSIPIAAQYEAPNKLTPVEVGYLMDENSQNQEIAAEIVYLATQGCLTIERLPKQGWFGKDDFKLTKTDKNAPANLFDDQLLKKLFPDGRNASLISQLKKDSVNRKSFKLSLVPERLTALGYYAKDPNLIRVKYTAGLLILWFILIWTFSRSPIYIISVIAAMVAIGIFGYFMPKKTQKGADAMQMAKGLKLYLSVAEKDRLEFHNAPNKDPKIFEKLLPYAMALGVSELWAKQFEGIVGYEQPSWYHDPSSSRFNFLLFNAQMNSFNRGFNSMVVANSRGAAGGASGFGGGGFSGGGFGGGGGGSW